MKNKTTHRPTQQTRLTTPRRLPLTTPQTPERPPEIRANEFLNLCFYPGMSPTEPLQYYPTAV
jgi:hypothetical protein